MANLTTSKLKQTSLEFEQVKELVIIYNAGELSGLNEKDFWLAAKHIERNSSTDFYFAWFFHCLVNLDGYSQRHSWYCHTYIYHVMASNYKI